MEFQCKRSIQEELSLRLYVKSYPLVYIIYFHIYISYLFSRSLSDVSGLIVNVIESLLSGHKELSFVKGVTSLVSSSTCFIQTVTSLLSHPI